MKTLRHGGYIYDLLREGVRYEDILDFSASINPLGMPDGVYRLIREGINQLANYPDPYSDELRKMLSLYHEIEQDSIIIGNGCTELIYLVVRALRPRRILIPQPTFSEYERACMMYGALVEDYYLKKEEDFDIDPNIFLSRLEGFCGSSHDSSMVFLCNPNNPTGRVVKRNDLLKIASASKSLRCYLVVDEAFMDFLPEESIIKDVSNNPYLVVLRSMTKFYCLAGLRLGYGVVHPELSERLMEYKEPWTVNTLAQRAGTASLMDHTFREETLRKITEWKGHLESLFKDYGINYIPSAVNFYLFNLNPHDGLIPYLRRKGILLRDCSDFKGLEPYKGRRWFRMAVRSPQDHERLFNEWRCYSWHP